MPSGRKRTRKKPHPQPGLGRRLAVLRTALKLTQSEFARLADMRQASLSDYEADIVNPEAPTLEHILRTMGFRWSALDLTDEYLDRLFGECSISAARARGAPDESDGILDPEEDRKAAATAWQQFQGLKECREEKLQETPARIAWAVCELLCLESHDACRQDLSRAEELLDAALRLADRVTGSDAWRAKVRAFVWLHIANALRVRGKLKDAERAFVSAEHLWEAGREGRADLLEEGLRFALMASLRRAQRRFEEAAVLLGQAAAIARAPAFRVQVLVSKAKLLEETGDLEGAAQTLLEAKDAAVAIGEKGKLFYIEHNLSDILSKLGRYEEAAARLPEVRRLSRHAGEIDRARSMWTAGRIAVGTGKAEEGIGLLVKVRGEFASREMGYDTALVTLELATAYAAQGRTGDVKTLARHLVPVFQAKDLHQEALAALTLFRQAAEREAATVELARRILDFLRRARHNPELRFQAA